jgi:hypothetical protein
MVETEIALRAIAEVVVILGVMLACWRMGP